MQPSALVLQPRALVGSVLVDFLSPDELTAVPHRQDLDILDRVEEPVYPAHGHGRCNARSPHVSEASDLDVAQLRADALSSA